MSGLTSVGYFLFSIFFSMLTFILWARFGLRYFRVSSLHQTSQALNSLTNPIVKPLEGLFKSSKTRAYRYDWACFTVLVIAEFLKFTCMSLLFWSTVPSVFLLVFFTLADLIIQPCNVLFYAVIIRVVMSWVSPQWRSPFADLIYLITDPLIRFARRFVPLISGIDCSPMIVIIILKVITLFVGASLPASFI